MENYIEYKMNSFSYAISALAVGGLTGDIICSFGG
jgi:hypothetical protein